MITLIRRLLARAGYEIRRQVTAQLEFDDCLRTGAGIEGSLPPAAVHVFDDDTRVQNTLLNAFGATVVRLHHHRGESTAATPGGDNPISNGGFWVVTNGERDPLHLFAEHRPWAMSSALLLVTASLEAFSRGSCDLAATVQCAERAGYVLTDIASSTQPVPFNSPGTRIALVFSRRVPAEDAQGKKRRLRRLDEAWAFLASPAAQRSQFRWLAGRGSFGFETGVFNPGACRRGSQTILLARGERIPWPLQAHSEKRHFAGWSPVLLELDQTGAIARNASLEFKSPLPLPRIRVEDFRLFPFGGRLLSNHSIITLPRDRAPEDRPVRLETQRARVALSVLAPDEGTLTFLGFPSLDFDTAQIEKNWAMMSAGEELYLIYSISPYRVLRAAKWPRLEFTTLTNRPLVLPFAQDGRLVRNSVNPVVYDDRHYLHLVHKVYPDKQYVYWALLLDRKTLCPAYVSSGPIVRAGASLAAGILYVCSVVAGEDRLWFFAGINDCGSGVWEIKRADLDGRWQAVSKA